MDIIQQLQNELTQEYHTTKKFLANFPEGKNDFAPHEKSMKMMPLATHIVEIFAWPNTIMNTEVLDFAAGDYKPTVVDSKEALKETLDKAYEKGKQALQVSAEALDGRWKMAQGDYTIADWSKYEALRHAFNQVTHHRAQLGVYYRLLGVDVPGSYGPSADEQSF